MESLAFGPVRSWSNSSTDTKGDRKELPVAFATKCEGMLNVMMTSDQLLRWC
jgi:hypothetical protein